MTGGDRICVKIEERLYSQKSFWHLLRFYLVPSCPRLSGERIRIVKGRSEAAMLRRARLRVHLIHQRYMMQPMGCRHQMPTLYSAQVTGIFGLVVIVASSATMVLHLKDLIRQTG